jgi:hypothetical protein
VGRKTPLATAAATAPIARPTGRLKVSGPWLPTRQVCVDITPPRTKVRSSPDGTPGAAGNWPVPTSVTWLVAPP